MAHGVSERRTWLKQLSMQNIRACRALILREIQIETTTKYHLLSVIMAIVRSTTKTNASIDVEKRKHLCTEDGSPRSECHQS